MAKAHGALTLEDRKAWFEELRQELQGRPQRGGPFNFVDKLDFSDVAADAESPNASMVDRFKKALARDAAHATAGPVYLRLLGYNKALRNVYDGGRQLIDGGLR